MSKNNSKKHFIQRPSCVEFPSELDDSINKMNDSIWYVYSNNNTMGNMPLKINWSMMKDDQSLICKGFIRWKFSRGNFEKGKIYANEKTLKNSITYIRKFLDVKIEKFNNRLISELSLEDLKNIIKSIKSGPHKYESFLRGFKEAYDEGYCFDGISVDLPSDLSRFIYRDDFKSEKKYKEWLKGGSWGNLPVSTAMLYLHDCMDIIDSENVNFLLEYFNIQKSINSVPLEYIFSYTKEALIYRVNDFEINDLAISDDCKIGLIKLSNLLNKYGFNSENKLNKLFVRDESRKILNSAFIICLMLTGIRISELASIKVKDIADDGKGNFTFRSNIYKTHSGIAVIRSLSGVAYNAMKISIGLAYRKHDNDSIFSHAVTSGYFDSNHDESINAVRSETLGQKVPTLYESWLADKPENIKKFSPDTTSAHSMRHIFCAVALRRFDGRVSNKIKAHFFHAFKSRYIKSYVDKKYDQDYQYAAEREYINEIISDIALGDKDFYGPVAVQIKKRILEDHRFLSLDEFDDAVKSLSLEFENIVPHEFGYCVPRTYELAKAQCKDRETGEARIWEESSLKNCSNCVHRLTHKSQAESVARIAISHQNFIDGSPLTSIASRSKDIVKKCSAMLNEMNFSIGDFNGQ